MGFFLRLTDRAGRALRGTTTAARPGPGETPAALGADPVRFVTAYEALAERAEAGTAADRLVAGRTLHLSGTVDPTDNQAQKLLERAAQEAPGAEAFYWLMRASTDAVKAGRAADELALLAGDDAYLLAEAAARRLTAAGPRGADLLSQRALAVPGGADDATVVAVRAMVLASRGLVGACSALLSDWLAGHAPTVLVLQQQRTCLRGEGRTDEADAISDRLAELDRGRTDRPLERLRLLAARRETDAVRRLAGTLVAEFRDDLGTLQQVAGQLHAAGASEDAVALLRRLTDECPQHPSLAASLGGLLESLGRREEAIEPYRRAVELEPQNQPLKQYLEFIDERQSIEQRWAVPFEALAAEAAVVREALAAMAPAARERLQRGRDLFRQEVHVIHPNGLSSRVGQTYTLVQTDDGAEQFRYMRVPYTPGEERFELLRAVVIKPDGHTEDYEGHYPLSYGGSSYFSDEGAEAISFPRLGVGDIVELRFRIDGRSRQNKFGEHFSTEVGVLGVEPCDRFRYVLVAPETKLLYVHLPAGMGFTEETRTEDGETVRIHEVRDLPAIPEEPNAPPPPELSRPIQVSTFADWEALGRWWWGLVSEQLQPDETIRTRAAEIVAGTDDPAERVARIFDWVIRNTRYVAMEFGIHGWKPYRAHDVVSRGFGDCKDKAGLIYAMLAAVGIESRLVLIRTRAYRGRPVSEFPALGHFDHVISYVPSLDLYLDGTITLADTDTLPSMDRGAMALIVGPDEQRLVTTPDAPRGPELMDATWTLRLRPDGSAAVSADASATGAYAYSLRGPVQAAETRRQRTEEILNGIYPGLELGDYRWEGLDDFRQPLEMHVDGEIPQLAAGDAGGFSIAASRPRNLARAVAPTPQRELEVDLFMAIHERRTMIYELPEGAADVHVPERREARDGRRSFVLDVARDGSRITVTWELHVPDPRIPVAEYPAFRAFCAAVDTALAETITYEIR